MRVRPDVVYHSITKSAVLYSKSHRNCCLAASLLQMPMPLAIDEEELSLFISNPFTFHSETQRTQVWSPLTSSVVAPLDSNISSVLDSLHKRNSAIIVLTEAIKLPTEWHRFGYTHVIVKHLPGRALHCIPSAKGEHVKLPHKTKGSGSHKGDQGASYWNGEGRDSLADWI